MAILGEEISGTACVLAECFRHLLVSSPNIVDFGMVKCSGEITALPSWDTPSWEATYHTSAWVEFTPEFDKLCQLEGRYVGLMSK